MGAYVHVPFCARRCGYCAFATVAVGDQLDRATAQAYLQAVRAEVELVADGADGAVSGRPLSTVYLGGGTPTMLEPDDVADVLQALRDGFGTVQDLEVTVEANPDGLRPGQLLELRDVGVTRVSFGLQSVRRHVLALLDRTHSPDAALRAAAEAVEVGIDHVGLDLILGTPGESDADLAATLDAAVCTGADHISAYALSVEPGTRLAARVRTGALTPPCDDTAARRYDIAERMLSDAGFEWYELSNWSRSPGARSRHNLLYWRNDDWLGFGPSAHSHVDRRRWWNHDAPSTWTRDALGGRQPVAGRELVDDDGRRLEDLMLGIRLREGLAARDLDSDVVASLRDEGLLDTSPGDDGDRVVLTRRGRLLADAVVLRLAA